MWGAPRLGPVTAICAAALAACAPISLGDGERRTALRELGTGVIVPQLFELATLAAPMSHEMERVGEVRLLFYLASARERWRGVRRAWKRAEAFGFGPAAGLELDRPADPAQIEAELAGEVPIDTAYVAGLPGPRRGFHAIEYLLFREDGDDAAVLSALATPRRQQYLVAATHDLVARIGELRDEWTDAHADRLATPAADDPDYPTIERAIGVVVGECAAVAGRIADARLDQPGGLTAGAPRPELEESARSDNSIADMADALRGLRNVYYGTRSGEPGAGLGALVAAAAPAADARARAAIEDALAAIERIPAPYRATLAEGRPEVAAAHAAVAELRRILASDVTPVLAGATMPAD
jgi:predicted lipoprotein